MPDKNYQNFDDVKCLWMKCGMTDYRICDNNFECETCSYDKQIKSRLNKKDNVREEIESAFDYGHYTIPFSHPNYHFKCGLIVKNFIGNNYYIGLEPYIAKFIDQGSLLNYISNGVFVKTGEPVLNIRNGWGEVNVLSPFQFRFVEKLELKNIIANGIRWFAIIEAEKHDIIHNSISENAYYEKLYDTKTYLKECINVSETAGATMYDGGKPLENWQDIIGKSNYKELIVKLFT